MMKFPPFVNCGLPCLAILWSSIAIISLEQPVLAGLHWEKTILEATAKEYEKELHISFSFANKGSTSVAIRKIRTCCGCLVAKTAKMEYQPNEVGAVEVVFAIGDRKGRQEKTIVVETSSPEREEKTLILRVDILQDIQLSRKAMLWRRDE